MIGTSIAHYKITAKLGEGGMGAVYRATDTKLNRDVAIKVLPNSLAADADRLARFTREAQVLASLNHPNIAAIYGVEQRALIMELVDGKPIQGPLPLDTALAYARQIADALEAAHEKGVVHRDLKPANVMVTHDGVIKVLDFGLAKAPERAPSSDPENSPTLTMGATEAGVIMGTASYMAPEQASGKSVDKRADIWAFGVVLCELLTGKRMFEGETVSHTLASVLKDPIELPEAPPQIRNLLSRCLDRNPKRRLQAIGEARIAIDDFTANPQPVASAKRPVLPWALCGAFAVAAVAALTLRPTQNTVEAPVRRFTIPVAELTPNPVISPNGKWIAYRADNKLWIRGIDQESARAVDGVSDSRGGLCWSPDSDWLSFGMAGKLLKVNPSGQSPIEVGQVSNFFSCSWSNDAKSIYWTAGVTIQEFPATGGAARKLHSEPGAVIRFFNGLETLPSTGAPKLLFTRYLSTNIVAFDGAANKLIDLGIFGSNPKYAPSGHIVFTKPADGNFADVWAAPFDVETLRVTGSPFPVVRAAASLTLAHDGTAVYAAPPRTQVAILDKDGKRSGVLGAPQPAIFSFSVSPDAKRLAAAANLDGNVDIWIHDNERGVKSRFTSSAEEESLPWWSPDGKSLAYVNRDKSHVLVQTEGGPPVVIGEQLQPGGWTPDGQSILATKLLDSAASDPFEIYLLSATSKQSPRLLQAAARHPRVSPNGKFLAYSSSGEVFVRPFPESGASTQISANGGAHPRWHPNGRELYFLSGNRLMVAPVNTQGAFSVEAARALFEVPQSALIVHSVASLFELLPDNRFAVAEQIPPADPAASAVHVIENFPALLRQPSGR